MLMRTNTIFTLIFLLSASLAYGQSEIDSEDEKFYRRQAIRALNYGTRVEKKKKVKIQEEGELEQQAIVSNSSEMKLDVETPDEEDTWGAEINMMAGHSSNVARFEGAPAGSFVDLIPRAYWSGDLSERLQLDVSGEVFYRSFTDQEIDDVFRTFIANANGRLSYDVTQNVFMGVGGESTLFDGREIDFTTPETNGRDSRLAINKFEVFLGREGVDYFVMGAAGAELVRAETTVVDEVGNQFFPDLNQTHASLSFGKQVVEDINLEAGYTFRYRQFIDQRARLENGAVDPNFATAPKLEELENGVLGRINLYRLSAEFGAEFVLDQIAGAADRQSYFASLSLPIRSSRWLTVIPDGTIRYTSFDNFVGELFRNPNATRLREDQWVSFGVEAVFDLGWIKPVLTARRTALESTFSILDFEEDLVSAGFRIQF